MMATKRSTTMATKKSATKTAHGVKVDQIIHKQPQNGLPKWIKDAAEERGYGDALQPISLYVTEDDINAAFDCAAQGDGTKCVMAQAGQRLGAQSVYFYRTTAWIDFGVGPILRFKTSQTIYNNVIKPFDKGNREAVTGGVYPLTPPSNSASLKRRREYDKGSGSKKNPAGNRKKKAIVHTERVVMAAQA